MQSFRWSLVLGLESGLSLANRVHEIPFPRGTARIQSARARPADTGAEAPRLAKFVVGPENALVDVAVEAVLERPAEAYNPIVFHGPSGTGKSHLVSGLARGWKASRRAQSVVHATAADFARDLGEAIETQTVSDFHTRYTTASLLVLEDLQALGEKRAAQRELLQILDASGDTAQWVVLTSRVAPRLLAGFTSRLKARLIAGLTVPLVPPALETRLVILERLAARRKTALPEDVLRTLAERLPVTVPGLAGALTQLEGTSRLDGQPIDVARVEEYIAALETSRQPPLRDIARLAARHFSLKLADLRGPSRCRSVVAARGVAMYLARRLTQQSLEQIGRYFGGRDHKTVSHSCRRTVERLKTEPGIRQAVTQLESQLKAA